MLLTSMKTRWALVAVLSTLLVTFVVLGFGGIGE
jgi:succinate-acetate transporter protein